MTTTTEHDDPVTEDELEETLLLLGCSTPAEILALLRLDPDAKSKLESIALTLRETRA